MKAKAGDDWIDPAAARRLLLEYRGKLGVQGASEIAQRIKRYTGSDPNGSREDGFDINRKTIENLMNDRGGAPSGITLTAIARFMRTEHFQTLVPRARDYLESDARLCRIGSALFDLYGATDLDSTALGEINTRVAGWWVKRPFAQEAKPTPGHLCIVPVAAYQFSKIHIALGNEEVPDGSGVVFASGPGTSAFSVRMWTRDEHPLEKDLQFHLVRHDDNSWPRPKVRELALHLFFEPRRRTPMPESYAFVRGLSVTLLRADEGAIPAEIRDRFDEWNREALPQRMKNRGLGFTTKF